MPAGPIRGEVTTWGDVDTVVPSRQGYSSPLARSFCLSFAVSRNFMFKGSDDGRSVVERKDDKAY